MEINCSNWRSSLVLRVTAILLYFWQERVKGARKSVREYSADMECCGKGELPLILSLIVLCMKDTRQAREEGFLHRIERKIAQYVMFLLVRSSEA
jgi:hypothetical protein